jgi:hypothetical protein
MGEGHCAIPGALVEVAAHRVQPVVAGDPGIAIERRQQPESLCRPAHHGCGHGMVERHHRVVRHRLQQVVEPEDPGPVGRFRAPRRAVQPRDRGLELVGADGAARQGAGEDRGALGDAALVPAPAVLLVERDQLAALSAAGQPPGVGEQHEREQSGYLPVLRQPRVEPSGEPDGLLGEVHPVQPGSAGSGVPFVEHQVEDVEHPVEPLGAVRGLGMGEGHVGRLHGRLGPADPLGHRRFRHEERARDLRGREAAYRAEGERDGGRRGQRRMAAHEQQQQAVVPLRPELVPRVRGGGPGEVVGGALLPPVAGLLAPAVIGEPAEGDPVEPAAGIVGKAGHRPLAGGGDQRLLHRVLRRGEVVVAARDSGQHLRRELAQQGPDAGSGLRPAHLTPDRGARSSPDAPRSE